MTRVGTAGWVIPRAAALRFDSVGTHLQRYARRLNCAEINSAFYRPHAHSTYAKWRDSTPPDFKFSIKVPRTITHERKLRDARDAFVTFVAQTDGLAEKRGPLLLQLPPSLAFDASVVSQFLEMVRQVYRGPMVCEPRHPTWFSPAPLPLFSQYDISRVAADPPPVPEAATATGCPHVTYFRLHGSPRTYWSRYDRNFISRLALNVRNRLNTAEAWCVFDNTASGAAIENAWELREELLADSDSG